MMGGVPLAISISGLVKTFGSTRALDGLDLSVEAVEVHGFLGPNGPGLDLLSLSVSSASGSTGGSESAGHATGRVFQSDLS